MAEIDSATVGTASSPGASYGYYAYNLSGSISDNSFNITGTPTITICRWLDTTVDRVEFGITGDQTSNQDWVSMTVDGTEFLKSNATTPNGTYVSALNYTVWGWTSANVFASAGNSVDVTWDGADTDSEPNAFNFADVTTATTNTVYDTYVQITGIDVSITASLLTNGDGTFAVSNSTTTPTSGFSTADKSVSNNQYVHVKQTSSTTAGSSRTMTIYMGSPQVGDDWRVVTSFSGGTADFSATLDFDNDPGDSQATFGATAAKDDIIDVTLDTTINSLSASDQAAVSAAYNWDLLSTKNSTCLAGFSGGDGDVSRIRVDCDFDSWWVLWRFYISQGKAVSVYLASISGNQRAPLPVGSISMNEIHINVSKTSTVSGTTCTLNDADFRAVRATDSTYDGGDGIDATPGSTISIGEFRNATAGPFLLNSYYRSLDFGGVAGLFVSPRNRALYITDNGYEEHFTGTSGFVFSSGGSTSHNVTAGDFVVFSFDYVANWDTDQEDPVYETVSTSQTLKQYSHTGNLSEITTVIDYVVLADSGTSYTWDYADLGNINGGNYHNRRIASFTSVAEKSRWQVSWLVELPSDWIGDGNTKKHAATVSEEMTNPIIKGFI